MDTVCNYCKSEVELDNNEVLAKSFKCPICEKENEFNTSDAVKSSLLSPSKADKRKIKFRLLYMYLAGLVGFYVNIKNYERSFTLEKTIWLILLPITIIIPHIIVSAIILFIISLIPSLKFKLTAYKIINVAFWLTLISVLIYILGT